MREGPLPTTLPTELLAPIMEHMGGIPCVQLSLPHWGKELDDRHLPIVLPYLGRTAGLYAGELSAQIDLVREARILEVDPNHEEANDSWTEAMLSDNEGDSDWRYRIAGNLSREARVQIVDRWAKHLAEEQRILAQKAEVIFRSAMFAVPMLTRDPADIDIAHLRLDEWVLTRIEEWAEQEENDMDALLRLAAHTSARLSNPDDTLATANGTVKNGNDVSLVGLHSQEDHPLLTIQMTVRDDGDEQITFDGRELRIYGRTSGTGITFGDDGILLGKAFPIGDPDLDRRRVLDVFDGDEKDSANFVILLETKIRE